MLRADWFSVFSVERSEGGILFNFLEPACIACVFIYQKQRRFEVCRDAKLVDVKSID